MVLHSDVSRDICATSRNRDSLSSFLDFVVYFWKHPAVTGHRVSTFHGAFSWSACRKTIPGSFPLWCFLFRLGVSSPPHTPIPRRSRRSITLFRPIGSEARRNQARTYTSHSNRSNPPVQLLSRLSYVIPHGRGKSFLFVVSFDFFARAIPSSFTIVCCGRTKFSASSDSCRDYSK